MTIFALIIIPGCVLLFCMRIQSVLWTMRHHKRPDDGVDTETSTEFVIAPQLTLQLQDELDRVRWQIDELTRRRAVRQHKRMQALSRVVGRNPVRKIAFSGLTIGLALAFFMYM